MDEISDCVIRNPMGWIKMSFLFTFPETLVCLYGDASFKRVPKNVHTVFDRKVEKPTLWRCFHCGFTEKS